MDLSTITTKARRKLDEVTEKFWDDDELWDYINDGYYQYWMWMIRAVNRGVVKSTTLNITADTAEIALPSDYFLARLVERVVDSATIPMDYKERYDSANRTSGTSSSASFGYVPQYHFEGQNLIIEPTPGDTVANGIKLTYIFIPDRMTAGTDEPDDGFPDFFHDLLVGYCVIQAKEKEEMVTPGGADISPFVVSQGKREQMFKEVIELETLQRIYSEPWGIRTC